MSRIFDALQRAEDDRRGSKASSQVAAQELLERAEQQARTRTTSESRGAVIVETTIASGDVRQPLARTSRANGTAAKPEAVRTVPSEVQTLHVPRPFHNRLVALADQSSPAAEAFRLLCVRLRHLRKDRTLSSLLISSTSPEEGKSFTAANLACMLAARSQQSVVLVEGDVRRPSQTKIFGVPTMPGLGEYLRGKQELTESIYRLDEAGLWLMPAGRIPGTELIESARLTSMMAQLSRWFAWVIIDSPPVLPLADTSVWEKMADGILLVARRGVTAKRKLKRGTEAIDQTKLIGAILNSSTVSRDEDYYHYSRSSAEPETEEVFEQ
jgi:capsular exopolysaccharide synthesis family protein